MPLPQISHPLFTVVVPSSKKKIKLRPYTVKEEKILLMAQASEDKTDTIDAVKQVVNNCVVGDFDVDTAPTFDLEYIFIKLRAISVNNIVELTYTDDTDLDDKGRSKKHEFEIDLNNVEVKFTEGHSNKVDLGNDVGIILRYPSFKTMESVREYLIETTTAPSNEIAVKALFLIYAQSIDTVYDEDKIYKAEQDFTIEEIVKFVDDMNSKSLLSIQSFFETVPSIYYEVQYKNSAGELKTIPLTGLSDFFIL